ncbi:MAG: hypothetical protein SGJ18_06530 [Pseudomonadota bacterium]|nr:hypothetical protein [Pseudomonadota bacterium]
MNDNKELGKEKKIERKIKGSKENERMKQEQFRVVLDKEANTSLEDYMATVNTGFIGGKANKSEVANYILARIKTLLSESDIKAIRNNCFDDKEALASLSKSEQDLPDIVKKAIREAYGLSESSKKKFVKPILELSTNRTVDNSSAT